MVRHIPSRWSFIVKYIGGHTNIHEECHVILRFTRKKVEIESLGKGKIILDYNNCVPEMQAHLEHRRIVLVYRKSPESEGRIFLQVKKRDEKIMDIFHIYKNAALGLDEDISMNSKRYFKLFKIK